MMSLTYTRTAAADLLHIPIRSDLEAGEPVSASEKVVSVCRARLKWLPINRVQPQLWHWQWPMESQLPTLLAITQHSRSIFSLLTLRCTYAQASYALFENDISLTCAETQCCCEDEHRILSS